MYSTWRFRSSFLISITGMALNFILTSIGDSCRGLIGVCFRYILVVTVLGARSWILLTEASHLGAAGDRNSRLRHGTSRYQDFRTTDL